jgi:DNA-binding PadR family transcriptional regulator
MSLDYAILGFLSYLPFTGYDLKKFFDQSVRHFWAADQSQIYRTLVRLGEEGKVEMSVVEQTDRPNRKVYSITEKGEEFLRRWLASPFEGGDARNPVLLKTFFSGKSTDQKVLAEFEDAARQIRGMMTIYETTPAMIEHFKTQVGSEREAFFWKLTLEWGVMMANANLAWVESIIDRIKSNQVPQH